MVGIEPKKNDFLAHFQRFFVYILLRPTSYTLSFCQIKDLMKLHNRGKFRKHPWNGPFWEVFGSFLPQISLDFAKIFSWAILLLKKHTVWRILQNFEFFLKMEHTQNLKFWSICWAVFSPGKSKILAKPKSSPKTTSSALSNSIIFRSHKNHRILTK